MPASRTLVAGDQPLDVRFLSTIDSISGFLAFELTAPGGIITGFVVPVPLAGVPAERDQVLMRHLVGSQERFLRYLLASLEGRPDPGDPRPPGAIGVGQRRTAAPSRYRFSRSCSGRCVRTGVR